MLKLNVKKNSGFTLIELMIVVAIIGILAAIGISNFLNYQLTSKSVEAKYNLGSINSISQTYHSEYDFYLPCAANPTNVPGASKSGWTLPNGDFDLIGFAPSGSVYFSYSVIPGATGITSSFISMAESDLDSDGGAGAAPGGLGGAAVGTGAANANNGLFSLDHSGTFTNENHGVW